MSRLPSSPIASESTWRHVWMLYAAGILLFVTLCLSAYWVGVRHGTDVARSTPPTSAVLQPSGNESATLRRAKIPHFRIYDLRSTYATRLSAGGVADEWVTQLLRQGDAKVLKRYSQMKREALIKLNRYANEENLDPSFAMDISSGTARVN